MSHYNEERVEQLNNKLEDLNVAGTSRFTLADGLGEQMSAEALSTSRILIEALRYYDALLLPLGFDLTKDQILDAISPRHHSLSLGSSSLDIIDYLCTHLQAERLFNLNKNPKESSLSASCEKESPHIDTGRGLTLFQLDRICKDLQLSDCDISGMGEKELVLSIVRNVKEVKSSLPEGVFEEPPTIIQALQSQDLNVKQMQSIEQINSLFVKDFTVRRRMLLKRLDVTIQSFLWGASVKGKEDEILAVINAERQYLSEEPTAYNLDDALSAPVSLMHEHTKKVTGGHSRGQSSSLVKKVIIGRVPDRGGRPLTEARAKAQIAKENPFGRGGGSHGGRGRHNEDKNTRNNGNHFRNNKRGGGGRGHPSPKKGKL